MAASYLNVTGDLGRGGQSLAICRQGPPSECPCRPGLLSPWGLSDAGPMVSSACGGSRAT